jgi:undecaprenyl-phosphate 4-deoxy-4-formamido-L-arabinose transferase
VLGKPEELYLSPYKAIDREVVREVLKYDGPYPYVDGLLLRVTSNVTQVDAVHHIRYAGTGNFNLIKSVSTWLKVATSFSVRPLRMAAVLGFAFAVLGLLMAAGFAVRQLVTGGAPLGWASTIVTILVLGGLQLGCLGLMGEYLGRIFLHLNRRPQFVVKETCGGKAG